MTTHISSRLDPTGSIRVNVEGPFYIGPMAAQAMAEIEAAALAATLPRLARPLVASTTVALGDRMERYFIERPAVVEEPAVEEPSTEQSPQS